LFSVRYINFDKLWPEYRGYDDLGPSIIFLPLW